MEARIAVVFHSGYGHTARQGEAVAEGAAEVANTRVDVIRLGAELADEHWELLERADAVIFGSPTYMSGASAGFRSFTEGTSKVWNDDLRWRNKIAAGFTNSGNHSGDKLQTLVEMALFAAQHGMIWVGMAHTAGGTPALARATTSTGWVAGWVRWPSPTWTRARTSPPHPQTCGPSRHWGAASPKSPTSSSAVASP